MKILILSDSHGCKDCIIEVINKHRDADVVLFLGDGVAEIDICRHSYSDIRFECVRGNNDFATFYPELLMLTLENKRILMLHGHAHGVKGGLERAVCSARENGADILLFGHTHEPYESYIDSEIYKPLYVFNPGSIGRGYRGKTYGLLQISENNILFSHGEL